MYKNLLEMKNPDVVRLSPHRRFFLRPLFSFYLYSRTGFVYSSLSIIQTSFSLSRVLF
jgi:hypothetical protein